MHYLIICFCFDFLFLSFGRCVLGCYDLGCYVLEYLFDYVTIRGALYKYDRGSAC